ncbi:glycosyltransferase involved in cell wall biosynthesis [Endobacter medicaginis]|uniref:Glycosyltransferase involved in cell wall biosynthesis n=2 Tax=Endobacter medicaginis TaxID=1181271 RepID=A0A839V2C5_9PROT|nr:glycosyltransferase family 1 protein [Endobacter medicaginis]MBB3174640.1 glycosyltransferase involved in cell wall biosynthesis [Endobacter medicaginis]MCX5474668.1 glycosyltransferase family 1 protein [Endobacter medicaginis]
MSGFPTPLFVNGRFLTQSLSGVQRFATEITRGIGELAADAPRRPCVLTPRHDGPIDALGLDLRQVGRREGQAWEQLELPQAAQDGWLLNLGNTAPLRGRRQFVVLHDAGIYVRPEAYSPAFRLWYRGLQMLLLRGATRLVTVSAFSRDELARHLRIPPSQIDVIGEGADHILTVGADDAVIARNGLTPGRFVLAVGNLSQHKNLHGLGELARALEARGIPLVISGGLNAAVFRRGGDRQLPQPARYIGRVSDAELRALYSAAACFVFPSFYEGFGLPAGEAMACGCPVVAADIAPLHEVCGGAALYADPHRPAEIARQVLRVIDDPALAEGLRRAGLIEARRHRWRDSAAALLALVAREAAAEGATRHAA